MGYLERSIFGFSQFLRAFNGQCDPNGCGYSIAYRERHFFGARVSYQIETGSA